MKQELDEALVRDFPNLYRRRHLAPSETCMCWGFAVGEGWEPIIRELSAKLEAIILTLPAGEREEYAAEQVKEKFGGLRFYLTQGTDEMYAAINEAEAKCGKTCESCGEPGSTRGGGYIRVACDKCAKARVYV